jgi:metal-responsive CopG/Arc/MetJ family transcriptional regulator
MVERYTNISLPDELIEEIDRVVKQHSFGYKNRADLCKGAIRTFLQNLSHYEERKKFEIKKKK